MGDFGLMAHFAEIDSNNIVIRVLVVPDDQEHRGHEYLAEDLGLGGTWLQTSYNTQCNEHKNGGTAFRGNFAGPGWEYLPSQDIFVMQQPFPSWTLNETTATWEAPVPWNPSEHSGLVWDEENQEWGKPPKPSDTWIWDDDRNNWKPPVDPPDDDGNYLWDEDNQEWVTG